MQVGFVGLGNMGSAMANLVAENGFDVIGWEINREVVEQITREHRNERFLPGVKLHPKLRATQDLGEVVASSDVLFVAIPSVFIRKTLEPVADKLARTTIVVNLAKGIDAATMMTAFQTLGLLFPQNPHVMLSGPSIANEFSRGMPTVVVLAGRDKVTLMAVARLLDNDHFRTRFSDDAIGVELGGVLKNIYAIGLGIFDGKGIRSVNFRSSYLTIALEEMTKIGVALGARPQTFAYLAGMGDLLATSLSEHSHNRRMGVLLAKGYDLGRIRQEMGVLPEGYNTLKTALTIAEKYHVSASLAKCLWDVIHGRYEAEKFVYLFIRDFIQGEGEA